MRCALLLIGTRDGDGLANVVEEDGIIRYGSIRIDQRVRVATPRFDYMTHWNEYLDVQNAADVVKVQREKAGRRVRLVTTFDASVHDPVAFVPSADGLDLVNVGAALPEPLKLEDGLNKLAANISIGRNIGGVHYYSDYIDSVRMGEQIAYGILEEPALMYPKEAFIVSRTTFDGVPIGWAPCDDTEHLSEAAD